VRGTNLKVYGVSFGTSLEVNLAEALRKSPQRERIYSCFGQLIIRHMFVTNIYGRLKLYHFFGLAAYTSFF